MWMVELNIAGRKFVHYIPRGRRFTFPARTAPWRSAPQRRQTAA